ncbi:MAG: ADP-glyceromanno-heptose 6-epimerase [Candidatus Saganbacteria bacterium]|nr:ADP-glyceromanno-heptose 6-epimerase [Candidatus Saganbacteria bacterium]
MIILTGGAGFIGSCFLWKLNQEGITDLLIVDNLSDNKEKKRNLEGKSYSGYADKVDFIEQIKNKQYPSNVEAIFHIGACSSTLETNREYLLTNNYAYSKLLAQWALEKGIPFYYASSAATYGDGNYGYSDDDQNSLRLKPLNLYGESKQLFDLWVINNKLQDKLVGWKYFNVFGPNEYHKKEMRSVIVKAFEQIKKDGKVRLFKSYKPEYKDGEQQRDFVYIKDVVDLMFQFFKHPGVKGIYNVGTGKARSWNDLVKAIFSALGIPAAIEYIDMPDYMRGQYQYFTEADVEKLKQSKVNFKFRALEDSVRDYVSNYLDLDFLVL